MLEELEELGKVKARGSIIALCSSLSAARNKGRKKFTEWARFVKNIGIEGDEPPETWHQQVGILTWDMVTKVLEKDYHFEFGQCGENVCITSADLSVLQPGDFLWVGKALLVVTQLGKTCKRPCPVGAADPGQCAMSQGWIFARVVRGGQVCVEDPFVAMGS